MIPCESPRDCSHLAGRDLGPFILLSPLPLQPRTVLKRGWQSWTLKPWCALALEPSLDSIGLMTFSGCISDE